MAGNRVAQEFGVHISNRRLVLWRLHLGDIDLLRQALLRARQAIVCEESGKWRALVAAAQREHGNLYAPAQMLARESEHEAELYIAQQRVQQHVNDTKKIFGDQSKFSSHFFFLNLAMNDYIILCV